MDHFLSGEWITFRAARPTRVCQIERVIFRAARPRTFDHVCALIAAALDLFTATECRNFIRHCGYRVIQRYENALMCFGVTGLAA